jgi:methionyl-tRNA synthetase
MTVSEADQAMCALDFAAGINAVKEFIDAVNLYVTNQEPWKVAKSEDAVSIERLHTILYTIVDCLRAIAVLYHSVMPKASQELWSQLGAAAGLGELQQQDVLKAQAWRVMPVGSIVTKGAVLFPRLEDEAK